MPSRPASSRTSMHLHNNTSYAHPSAAARRAPAAAAHAGHDLYHESADFSHAAGLQQQQQNNSSSSSMQPFAYSRSALLSLWDDKASAPLPPDMAASLSALSTDHPHLNNNNNNNNNNHHQQHPAHLVIASESVGKPLGMAPMSPEEEKWFLQTASSSSSSSNNNNNNNNSSDMSNGSGRRQMLNGIGLGHAAASGGTTSPGGTGAMPRRANSNSLRSNGAGLAGIQGGVLGSVAPPPVSRRGHRNVDSVDGKTAMGSSRSGPSTPLTESPQATGARQAKDPLRSDGVATWRKSHDAPAATQRNGGASPPAHWDFEAEPGDQDDDDDNDIIAAAANASQRNHLPDSPQEPQQQARPTLPSRPSLADLAHDSEAVDLAAHASSRRSSAAPTPAGGASPAASMLVEDPLLRRRVFAAAGGAAPGSRTTSASSTPDPIGSSLPGASVSPAPGAALARPPGIPAPASPVKERPEDVQWQYQDPSGNVQGPFTGAQMQTWYEHQYFQDDLHVRRISPPQSAFLPLGTLKVKVGDSVKPFLTPPPSAQPAPEVPPWAASNPASAYQVPAVSSPLPFGQQPQQSPADPLFRAASGRPMSGGQQQQAYDPFSMASPMNGGLDQLQSLRAAALLQQQQQQPATDPWGMPIRQQPALSWQQQQQLQYLQQQQQQQLSAQFGLASPVSPMDHQQQQQQQQQPRHPVSLSPEVMAQPQPQPQAVASPWGAPAAEKVAAAQQAAASSTHDSPALSAGVIGSSAPQTPAFKPEPREEPQPQAQVEVKQVPTPAPAELPSQEAEKQEDTRDPATQAADAAAEALVQDQEEHDTNAAAKKAGKNAPKVNVLPSKSQGKAANKTNKAVVESETTPSVSPAPSSAASATSKAAPWAVPETSDQPTRISSGPSLREIQAKEAKEEEARKAATKKAKAAALASEQAVLAAQAEQEASMPWAQNGGSRSASSSATAASSSAAPWSQPVSSTHANGTKKSLKEIQQEEEARAKKLQAQKQAQQAQAASAVGASSSSSSSVPSVGVRAGGGYAGSLGPKTAPAPSPLGGSWATVGSNGKSSAPAVPKPAAPAPKPAAPAASVVKPAAPAPAKPAAQVASKPAPAPQPSEHQPSPEFLSWMKSALQGLTIPIEEFIQMLLQFPVQADASTLEIISDAVYANSRTLDGRRFAEQFALKRKADAGMSTKGKQPTVPPVAAPVPPTAAQILQAKPKQDDGFSFKVVPKKGKKGGRS